MERLVIAAVLVVAVAAVAAVVRWRRAADPPSTARAHAVPTQLDRSDFAGPDTPWLVLVFSSATCDACASMVAKAQVLASRSVAVQEIEFVRDRALHERYAISAVPTTVIADDQGVVRQSFLGPVSATDLWAAVAGVRDPDQAPHSCERHDAPPDRPT